MIIEKDIDGRKVRLATMRNAGASLYIQENMSKFSVLRKRRGLGLFRRRKPRDIEPDAEENRDSETADVELEEISSGGVQEEEAPGSVVLRGRRVHFGAVMREAVGTLVQGVDGHVAGDWWVRHD